MNLRAKGGTGCRTYFIRPPAAPPQPPTPSCQARSQPLTLPATLPTTLLPPTCKLDSCADVMAWILAIWVSISCVGVLEPNLNVRAPVQMRSNSDAFSFFSEAFSTALTIEAAKGSRNECGRCGYRERAGGNGGLGLAVRGGACAEGPAVLRCASCPTSPYVVPVRDSPDRSMLLMSIAQRRAFLVSTACSSGARMAIFQCE